MSIHEQAMRSARERATRSYWGGREGEWRLRKAKREEKESEGQTECGRKKS